ncbi:MAG: type III secretion system chaperone [Puniceicoccales bacterium]|jgi:hypothetical protein|nr:type III secretion system chaperone [Puniceicoccales bacterium]
MKDCFDIFRSYTQALGERLQIKDLDLDENNDCYLAFDGKYFVKCSVDPEREQFHLMAYIGLLPEDRLVYYRGLLESNHFWRDTAGANLSLDPEDGTLILSQYRPMDLTDSELFYDMVEKFVNAMEHWDTKRFEEWSSLQDSDAAESGTATMGTGPDNMMLFGV